jgi:hypothetical protein
LKDLKDPMIFPVFGRGRALLPLIGAGITPENIEDSGSFLVGACSCEVKELNPGFDLLLAADWNGLLFENGPPPEVAAARPVAATGEPELVSIPSGAPPTVLVPVADNEEAMLEFYYESTGLRNFILLGLALAAIVSVCVLKAFRALRR